jgi:hypothetical protein
VRIKIDGLNKLHRDLEQAQRAFKSLDGEITRLTFDPNDQASINAALRQLDNAFDAKLRPYRGNPLVEGMAKDIREGFRKGFLKRVEEAKREARNKS